MRTTLTLDPDVARLLKERMHRERTSFKEVVNDALRRGLAPSPHPPDRPPFRVEPHRTTLRTGIDARGLNRLVDELEDEAVIEKLRSRR